MDLQLAAENCGFGFRTSCAPNIDFWPITVVGTQNLFLSTCLHRLWRKVHFITLRQSSSRVPFLGL